MILHGDCLDVMAGMDAGSVQCCVTSPPYWTLRDYGVEGQLGLESTPEEYVLNMVAVFRAVRRVLRDDGTVWLNLGDSYAGSWGAQSRPNGNDIKTGLDGGSMLSARQIEAHPRGQTHTGSLKNTPGLKPKDLCGIPWRVAFALQTDGWYLRQDIIWHKSNPMPESVTDRCTKAHEYVFLLSKKAKYYYDADAIREPMMYPERTYSTNTTNHKTAALLKQGNRSTSGLHDGRTQYGDPIKGRNRRSVWTVATQGFSEAHFATFPEKLIEPCILAGTSARGCCPECGNPWTRVIERTHEIDKSAKGSRFNAGKTGSRDGGDRTQKGKQYKTAPAGWKPGCLCGLEHQIPQHKIDADPSILDDFEIEPYPSIPCTVLDPFSGAGTTGVVCVKTNRRYVGIELNAEYVAMSERRIQEAVDQGVQQDLALEETP